MTLAADAAPDFRGVLEDKIIRLVEADDPADTEPAPAGASH